VADLGNLFADFNLDADYLTPEVLNAFYKSRMDKPR